jgi:hypothetical protein
MPIPTQGKRTRTKACDIRVAVFEHRSSVRLRNSRGTYYECGKCPLGPTLQENRRQKAEPRVGGNISAT